LNDVAAKPLPKLEELHDVWWPYLEPLTKEALTGADDEPARSPEDMIEEILLTVRSLAAQGPNTSAGSSSLPLGQVNAPYDVSQFPMSDISQFSTPFAAAFTNSVAQHFVERQSTIELTNSIHPLLPEDARISFLKDPYNGQTTGLVIISSTEVDEDRVARITKIADGAGYRTEFVHD
jgi:hypothetical protein